MDHEPGLWACLKSNSWVTVLVMVPSGAHVRQVVSEACPNAISEAHHLLGVVAGKLETWREKSLGLYERENNS